MALSVYWIAVESQINEIIAVFSLLFVNFVSVDISDIKYHLFVNVSSLSVRDLHSRNCKF